MQYKILGEPMPVVVCDLSSGESMITEKGSMVWMSPNMKMETSAGGLGKAFGRMFSGEAMFQNIYTAQGDCLCVQLPRLHPGGADYTGPAGGGAEERVFGLRAGGGAVGVLPEEGRGRVLRRGGLYYAEALWQRDGFFGD